MTKQIPSQQHLKECLRYDSNTGKLYWRVRPLRHFANARVHGWWNGRYAGQEAFTALNNSGYFHGNLDGCVYLAHRVIWKFTRGQEPPPLVDHRDRNRQNNRRRNLRKASKGQNNVNSSRKAGVHFDKARNKWAAYTKKNGVKIHLGRFATEHQAREARAKGAREHHGHFAP